MTQTIAALNELGAYLHPYIKSKWFSKNDTQKALMKTVNLVMSGIEVDTTLQTWFRDGNITGHFAPETPSSLYVLNSDVTDSDTVITVTYLDANGAIATVDITLTDDGGGPAAPEQHEIENCLGFLNMVSDTAMTGTVKVWNGASAVYGWIAASATEMVGDSYFQVPAGYEALLAYWKPAIDEPPLGTGVGVTETFTVLKNDVAIHTVTISSLVTAVSIDTFPLVHLDEYDTIEMKASASISTATTNLQMVLVLLPV